MRREKWVRTSLGIVGVLLVLAAVICACFAPWLAPSDPNEIDLSKRLAPPALWDKYSRGGILGNDYLGRDVLSRLIYGARVSMLVGFMSVIISGSLGTVLGLIAGYKGGLLDNVIMAMADIQYTIPFLVLIIAVTTIIGGGTTQIILYLGIANWIAYARVARAEVLSARENVYVDAARAIGANDLRILFHHILPNVVNSIVVIMALGFGSMILVESSLSFLGLGVSPPATTWGGMVADARDYLETAWWPAVFPGLAIMMVVFGINLFGDWLRDLLDPRLKHAA
jgi:peptide/nickel transport system permease protein